MAAGGGLTFDESLTKYVGEFGRAQIRILLIASLFWIGNALLILLMVFHASPSPVKEHWWACADPADAACAEVFALTDPSREVCGLPPGSWTWTQPGRSIVSQFDMVCGSAWKSTLANSGFFMGYLIGSGVFGGVADTRGRKPVLFGCTAFGALATAAVGLSPNYVVYFTLRLLTGIGAAGQALTAYILATESVGPSWRGTAGVATQVFFIVGEFVLVLVAFLARPWRALAFACAAVNAALLLLWPLLPESPRWLLVRGRRDEATAILAKIAAGNGRAMPTEPLADMSDSGGGGADEPEAAAAVEEGESLMGGVHHDPGAAKHASSTSVSVSAYASASHGSSGSPGGPDGGSSAGKPVAAAAAGAAAKKPAASLTSMLLNDRHMLRRFLVLAYVWLVICMTYYGISLALGGLPGSIYVSFMIAAAAEVPANLVAAWSIDRYGRHNTMAVGMLLAGGACLGCAFAPQGMASSALAALGKFGCAGAFTIASIFTSEMFPTLVRSAVLGAENEAARVGGIAAPFIVLVGAMTGQASMPFIIFGVASLVAGVAILTLPETLGTALPDTMSDMGGIQSIFTTQPWRRGGWRQTLREMFRARGGPATARPSPHGTPTGSAFRHAAVHGNDVSVVHDAVHDGVHGTGSHRDGGHHAHHLHHHYGLSPASDHGGAGGGGAEDLEVRVTGAAAAPYGGGGRGAANHVGEAEHHALLHSATAHSDMFGGSGGGGGGPRAAAAVVQHSHSDGVQMTAAAVPRAAAAAYGSPNAYYDQKREKVQRE